MKLNENSNNPDKAKLSKTHCTAVLALGFCNYTAILQKVAMLRMKLTVEINKGRSKKPFWIRLDAMVAMKRQRSGELTSEGGGDQLWRWGGTDAEECHSQGIGGQR